MSENKNIKDWFKSLSEVQRRLITSAFCVAVIIMCYFTNHQIVMGMYISVLLYQLFALVRLFPNKEINFEFEKEFEFKTKNHNDDE